MFRMETTKKIVALLLLLSTAFCYSQNYYFEVKFKDKGASFSLSSPNDFLSDASLQKKVKREVEVDYLDFPVDTNYIKDVAAQGVVVAKHSKWRNSVLIETEDTSMLSAIRALPFVSSATYFTQYKSATLKTNQKFANEDPEWYAKPYGKSLNQISMLNGNFLHERGYRGQSMDIAVFDAGFPKEYTAVVTLEAQGRIKSTFNFIDNNFSVFEKSGHGAAVLSVLGSNDAHMFGAAPEANYHLFLTEDATSETLLEEYNWLMAAEMADSIGVDVVTSSLGYTTFDDTTTNHSYAEMDGKTTLVTQAANMLFAKGILVVASAGNEGDEQWHYIAAPADGDSVLAVGAVDANRNYAFFSSTGPSYDGDVKPNVSAQGKFTVLGYGSNSYKASSGTSFSAPLVAGLAACYWQAFPDLKNWELKNEIEKSASQFNAPDSLLGFGIPDFMKIYMQAKPGDEYTYGQTFLMSLRTNPFTNYIGIELYSAKTQDVKFILLDVNGKEICNQSKSVQANQYLIFGLEDLEGVSSGMYFLRVYGDNGEWITRKMVKE